MLSFDICLSARGSSVVDLQAEEKFCQLNSSSFLQATAQDALLARYLAVKGT